MIFTASVTTLRRDQRCAALCGAVWRCVALCGLDKTTIEGMYVAKKKKESSFSLV